jgi:hypothetical protein
MHEQGLDTGVGKEHLGPADAPRGRVALLRRREILTHFACHSGESVHGAKNGVLM